MNLIDKVMPVAVATAPKKRKKAGVPSYLIYETLNGRPLYYRNYKAVLNGQKKPAEVMYGKQLIASHARIAYTWLLVYAYQSKAIFAGD